MVARFGIPGADRLRIGVRCRVTDAGHGYRPIWLAQGHIDLCRTFRRINRTRAVVATTARFVPRSIRRHGVLWIRRYSDAVCNSHLHLVQPQARTRTWTGECRYRHWRRTDAPVRQFFAVALRLAWRLLGRCGVGHTGSRCGLGVTRTATGRS